ncbi:hypothetical protein KUV57_13485 [Epibacterium sp. DP7N7-1]|nr:hypothetical protein [Epibacterium sp. DP7N7-1]
MQDAEMPIIKDYLKRLALASIVCTVAVIIVAMGGKLLAPVLGVGTATMLCMALFSSAILVFGDYAGLFHFKPDEFKQFIMTPGNGDEEIGKRSAATAAAVPGSLVSALLITFMVEALFGLPMLVVALLYIAILLILITVSSAVGSIAASFKESTFTLLMVVALFGYAYDTGPDDTCENTEKTELSAECAPTN